MATGRDPNNETYWIEFKERFNTTFADTTQVQDATRKLDELRMKNDQLEDYNTEFSHLIMLSRWEENTVGTIEKYKRGLHLGLLSRILLHDRPRHYNLEDWKNSARRQHANWRDLENAKKSRGIFKDIIFGNQGNQGCQRRQYEPMQVDNATAQANVNTTQRTRLTPELRTQLAREGRCFYCREKGHQSYDCAKAKEAKKQRDKRFGNQGQARVTEVEETSTTTAPAKPSTSDTIAKKICELTEDQRHTLMTAIEQGF
jgi:hypothetical protein